LCNHNVENKIDISDIKAKKHKIQKEQKILKKLSSFSNGKDFLKNFKTLQKNFPFSIIINILDKYFKLILPYYTFLEDKQIANKILSSQLNKILNDFNTIYDKISIKI